MDLDLSTCYIDRFLPCCAADNIKVRLKILPGQAIRTYCTTVVPHRTKAEYLPAARNTWSRQTSKMPMRRTLQVSSPNCAPQSNFNRSCSKSQTETETFAFCFLSAQASKTLELTAAGQSREECGWDASNGGRHGKKEREK